MSKEKIEMLSGLAHKILLREQDRCDFQIYLKMAAGELLAAGKITETEFAQVST